MAQFSAFYQTSSPEYPYLAPVDTLLHDTRSSWSSISVNGWWKGPSIPQQSRLEAHHDGTVSWKHGNNSHGPKLLSVYRATVSSCEERIFFFYFNSSAPPSNGVFYHRKMQGWRRTLDFPVKKWVSEHCGTTKWESWITPLEDQGYPLPTLSWI